jgi:hypothetical protein
LVIANAAGVLAVAGLLMAQAPEMLFGTWTVDVSKSKFSPGPAPKSNTKKFEPWKDGFKATQDIVTAKGDKVHVEMTGKADGKDYPATGSPDTDTFAIKRLDAHTYEVLQKKDGKLFLTGKIVIAPDGKSRVVTQTGTNAKGEPVNNTVYSDKH